MRIPPPLVFVAAVALGILLQRIALPLPLGLPESVRYAGAIGAFAFGFGFMVIAWALFKRSGQDPRPWTSTPEIVAKGVYQLSRNPMYLGMALLQGGLGLAQASGWILLLLPPAMLVIDRFAIRPEEAYLEEKFGSAYREYKASVRRWI